MTKTILLLAALILSISISAQPIKTTPIGFAIQEYSPIAPTINNKPVPGPRGPQGIKGKDGSISALEAASVLPDMSYYVTQNDLLYLDNSVSNEVGKLQSEIAKLKLHVANADSIYFDNMLMMTDNMYIHQLQDKGKTEIISGIGLQVIALALIAYSNTDIVTPCKVTNDYALDYQYNDYELLAAKCDRYKLRSLQKTGRIDFKLDDYYPCIIERNKTPYYISAGILAGIGTALEVFGIINLHNAHVYASSNGIGMKYKF